VPCTDWSCATGSMSAYRAAPAPSHPAWAGSQHAARPQHVPAAPQVKQHSVDRSCTSAHLILHAPGLDGTHARCSPGHAPVTPVTSTPWMVDGRAFGWGAEPARPGGICSPAALDLRPSQCASSSMVVTAKAGTAQFCSRARSAIWGLDLLPTGSSSARVQTAASPGCAVRSRTPATATS